jgi:NDP-sugar pyrophosphorylase family protein
MKAMVLAAGLGTRLRPLTNDRPKALVELAGRTLLEITLTRLKQLGIREVIINVHHFADLIVEHLQANNDLGMHIAISREEILLDTGGGLKKAASFFQDSEEPFILHNVDVVSNIDLAEMIDSHRASDALATVAVQQRPSSRYLLFDANGDLCGRRVKDQSPEIARPIVEPLALAFCGIHVISPRLLNMLDEQGVFSIIPPYLRLAATGERIHAFRVDRFYWRDLGTPEHLAQAANELQQGLFT